MKTITYTEKLSCDKQLRELLEDLGYKHADSSAYYYGVVILDPETILDMWHEHLEDMHGEQDEEVTLAQLVEKYSPKLVSLFEDLTEFKTQNIGFVF